jgi:hypothetical protein
MGFRLMRPQWIAALACAVLLRAAATVPHIEVLEGDGAINNIGLHRAKEPVVRVADQDGHPLANVAVTFVLPEQGPSGIFTDGHSSLTVMTDESGQAVGHGLRPNGIAGQFHVTVTVSYQGQAATAILTQTNAEPAAAAKSSKTLIIVGVVAGVAAAGAAIGLAGKKSGSSSSSGSGGGSSGIVITPGSPSFGAPHQ